MATMTTSWKVWDLEMDWRYSTSRRWCFFTVLLCQVGDWQADHGVIGSDFGEGHAEVMTQGADVHSSSRHVGVQIGATDVTGLGQNFTLPVACERTCSALLLSGKQACSGLMHPNAYVVCVAQPAPYAEYFCPACLCCWCWPAPVGARRPASRAARTHIQHAQHARTRVLRRFTLPNSCGYPRNLPDLCCCPLRDDPRCQRLSGTPTVRPTTGHMTCSCGLWPMKGGAKRARLHCCARASPDPSKSWSPHCRPRSCLMRATATRPAWMVVPSFPQPDQRRTIKIRP